MKTDLERVLPPGGGDGPVVILVHPQMGENIGACARAMLNCGLTELRLVKPRDGWPNERATANASGAGIVLERATLYETTAEALADLQYVYATTARDRDMVKPVVTPRQAAAEMRGHAAEGRRVGILFGPERTGLENDDVARADAALTVPLNPNFTSLNLGQAVLLVGYEWYQAGDATPPAELRTGKSEVATKDKIDALMAHLERELRYSGFLRVEDKIPSMLRNIRNCFNRMAMTEQEVRTFHGIVASLAHPYPQAGAVRPERSEEGEG
ncbi:MAG TPA: RNA methyltransferase [Alphaproteobacteria bacterium]|nr:RNA methyltransferase [Alphaproteobacteria bacterium]